MRPPEPPRASPTLVAAVVIGVFLSCWGAARFFDRPYGSLLEAVLSYYTWYWLPPLAALLLLFGQDAPRLWGLRAAPLRSLGMALLMSTPALAGFLATSTPHLITFNQLMLRAVLPGFMEELLYRGFLLGILFKRARWGFVPAGLVAAAVFGVAHLYQASDLSSALGVLAVTALGSFWFGWLMLEWDSLWVPVGLHVLLNLYWEVFTSDSTALGDPWSNLFRGLVIALSILLTRRLRPRRVVRRDTLWRT